MKNKTNKTNKQIECKLIFLFPFFYLENYRFFEDCFGKTALNQELALFSAVWKQHYTGVTLIETALNREFPIQIQKIFHLVVCTSRRTRTVV